MDNLELNRLFSTLSTHIIADACLRLDIIIRSAPQGLNSLLPGSKVAGRALPVKHKGSIDVFLEAMLESKPGDILCVDNGGRLDEGCIGHFIALEAQTYKMAGLAVWGCHRDTDELIRIGLPVFSYGRHPIGPQQVELTEEVLIGEAHFGHVEVTEDDMLFLDTDGAIFVYLDHVEDVLATAKKIGEMEADQIRLAKEGINLHQQFQFDEFLEQRSQDPSYSFREHMRLLSKTIED